MDLKGYVREDLWKSIEAHYERDDYTESIRDAIYHMCELIRDKSGFYDKDGTTLVETALMGKDAVVLVNKNETKTEKDIQQGIANTIKGIIQFIRNPMSHEKKVYSQKEAIAIILYIDYLLNILDHSGGKTKIDNIKELLFDEDFTATEQYAKLLLREVPNKKRYDLLLDLFYAREELPQHRLTNFINSLFGSLTKAEKEEFYHTISINLMKCKDDYELRMYCHYFMDFSYEYIDVLARLRMEDLFFKSIKNGSLIYLDDEWTSNDEGTLATWIDDKLDMLSNKEEILERLFWKIEEGGYSKEYVFEHFLPYIQDYFENGEVRKWNINVIKKRLSKADETVCEWLDECIDFWGNERIIQLFEKEYRECKKTIEEKNKLPF